MSYNDIAGTIGVGLACYASWLIHYRPFMILERIWCIVSIIGLVRTFK